MVKKNNVGLITCESKIYLHISCHSCKKNIDYNLEQTEDVINIVLEKCCKCEKQEYDCDVIDDFSDFNYLKNILDDETMSKVRGAFEKFKDSWIR